MLLNYIPLVDWSAGTFFLAAFLIVSAIMIIVVLNMAKGPKKEDE